MPLILCEIIVFNPRWLKVPQLRSRILYEVFYMCIVC